MLVNLKCVRLLNPWTFIWTSSPRIFHPPPYALFSMQAGTADNIRVAVTGHIPLNAIVGAKNLLWNACDPEIIGEKAKRKDSASRTESEAHVQDILHGLQKLD